MSLFLALLWQALAYSGAIFAGYELISVVVVLLIRDKSKRLRKKATYFSREGQTSALSSAMLCGFTFGLVGVFSPTVTVVFAIIGAAVICFIVKGFVIAFIENLTKKKPENPTQP